MVVTELRRLKNLLSSLCLRATFLLVNQSKIAMSDTRFVLKRIVLVFMILIVVASIIALFTPTPFDTFTFLLLLEGIALIIFGGALYTVIWGQKRYRSWTRMERSVIDAAQDAFEVSSQTRRALRLTGIYFVLMGVFLILLGVGLSFIF